MISIYPSPVAVAKRLLKKVLGKLEPYEDIDLLAKIKKLPRVTGVHIDSQNRIVVTTDTIYIRRNGENKIAGRYQIRIDFKHSYQMVRILNISQCWDDYDSPTIGETRPCWGTAEGEVRNYWIAKDLENLVETCLYYIASPRDLHGSTRWGSWFKYAYPMPKGFDFDYYDRHGRPSRPREQVTGSAGGASTLAGRQQIQNNVAALMAQAQLAAYQGDQATATRIMEAIRHYQQTGELNI